MTFLLSNKLKRSLHDVSQSFGRFFVTEATSPLREGGSRSSWLLAMVTEVELVWDVMHTYYTHTHKAQRAGADTLSTQVERGMKQAVSE